MAKSPLQATIKHSLMPAHKRTELEAEANAKAVQYNKLSDGTVDEYQAKKLKLARDIDTLLAKDNGAVVHAREIAALEEQIEMQKDNIERVNKIRTS